MSKKIHIESPQGKSKKNTLFKIIFILVNVITIAILLLIELKKGNVLDFKAAIDVLSDNIFWLLMACVAFFVNFFADSLCYYILIKNTTGEARLPLAMKVCLIGKYGDGVTPLGTGGQPFQMYYLHKYNIELTKATSIPLARTVGKVFGFNFTMLIFFIFLSQDGSAIVKTTAYVGLFFNSLLPFIILFFAFNRSWGQKITELILKIGFKFKIVKDFEKSKDYWLKKVDEMLKSIKYFNTHPTLLISILLLAVIEVLALATVPFFVYRAFGGGSAITWLFVATSTMYVMSASVMSPTPGTSGVAEGSFYLIFATVITNGLLFYAVITWRIITFYSTIIGGIILLIYESIYKNKASIDARDERKGRITNKHRAAKDTERQELLKANKEAKAAEKAEESSAVSETANEKNDDK